MEGNAPSPSESVPESSEEVEVPSALPATAEQPSRPSSADPLSQDELDMFLSPTTIADVPSSSADGDTLTSQPALPPRAPTPPFPAPTMESVHVPHLPSLADPPSPDVSVLAISDPCATPVTTSTRDSQNEDETEPEYTLKEIVYRGVKRKIMTQNVNGSCPLIAVVNALVLQGRFSFGHNEFKVSLTRVLSDVADKILSEKKGRNVCEETLDANVEAALLTLQKCYKGLDVNVRFGKVDDFEFTAAQALFDILKIDLYHGWIADEGILSVIGNRAYNEVTAFITEDSNEARLIKEWLDVNQSQLTFEGIKMLNDKLRHEDVAIMFRNNHFTTIVKNYDTMFILLTDTGFLALDALVFESLVDINQSTSYFTNGRFDEVNAEGNVMEMSRRGVVSPPNTDTTHDDDLALALSLHEEEMRLERERRTNQMRARNEEGESSRQPQQQQQRMENNQREKKKSSCSVM